MIRFKSSALVAGVAVVAGTLAAGGMTSVSAATAPLAVALSSCGTGSSVTWNASGDPVLTSGQNPAGTCGAPAGSTYNPSYAELSIDNVKGAVVPAAEPSFDVDTYYAGSGDPRFVIDLNNGQTMVGYPPQAGLNGTDMAWAVGNSGTYSSYATVYAKVDAVATTVKDAYITDDASTAGKPETLTNVQFGGLTLPPTYFVIATGLTNLVLDARNDASAGNGTAAQVWTQAGTTAGGNLASQSWQQVILSGSGATAHFALQLAGTSYCLDVTNFGVSNGTKLQLWTCGASNYEDQTFYESGTGAIYALHASQVRGVPMAIDDPNGAGAFTQLQIWQSDGRPQQAWSVG